MKNKSYKLYYLFSCIGVIVASYYPLSMGYRVISDMIADGTVMKENYPKYIIPYTPISIAIIVGVLLMPLFIRLFKKYALLIGAFASTCIFFATELLFEQKVVVTSSETVYNLDDWQMYMCAVFPDKWTTYRKETAVEILMGEYNPAFKLHFYIISVVLILAVLNCIYGFGQMIKSKDTKRLKALVLQSLCSIAFLGLCILACFTAFWRDGNIYVSPLSASLMAAFFILLGITVGVFVGSFLLGKLRSVSILVPSVVASVITLIMYIGEMILLNGHLYIFGNGFIFDSIPKIVLAPIDIFIIIASGCITAISFILLNNREKKKSLITVASVTAISVALVLVISALTANFTQTEDHSQIIKVQLLEKTTDEKESSYRVGADIPASDFFRIGKTISDKIAEERRIYNSMTEEQKLLSSKLWGIVSHHTDTWDECEEAIGFSVDNPIEPLNWLNKTTYYGKTNISGTAKHVQITANATLTAYSKLKSVSITAGYYTGNVEITLNAMLSADTDTFTTGSSINGYATFEETVTATKSGIPVLVVTPYETNNNGYYNGDYFTPVAYWAKGNVFYSLHLNGNETDKAEIQSVLERILNEI